MEYLNTRIHVLQVLLLWSFVLNNNLFFYECQRYMPGNPLLSNASKSSTSTSSQKLGVIIGVVVGGIATLTIILFFITYFVYFHHQPDKNRDLPRMNDVPIPHFSTTKVLGTGGKNRQTLALGKSSTIKF